MSVMQVEMQITSSRASTRSSFEVPWSKWTV